MRVLLWVLGLSLVAALTLLLLDDAPSPMATTPERGAAASPTRDLQPLDEPSRERSPATTPGASTEGSRWLRVMATLPNGAPAAAAVVRYRTVATESGAPRWAWYRDLGTDHEVDLTTNGRSTETDANGHASIQVAPDTTLCVRSGDLYGEAEVPTDASEVRVTLVRDVTLRVQVVDTDGRPREHFDVEAQIHCESRREGSRDDELRLPATDAQGMAVVPHLQTKTTLPGPDVVAWRMVLRIERESIVERSVTADEVLAGKPLLLRVLAGGAIVVEVVDADGKGIWAIVTLEDPLTGEVRDSRSIDGEEWFRQLPLGRRCALVARNHAHEKRLEILGPTQVDEVVRTRIAFPLRPIRLRGRVVLPDGEPVPGADIRFTGAPASFDGHIERSQSDAHGGTRGRFVFEGVLPTDVDAISGATLHIKGAGYCAPSTLAVAQPLRAGEHDLGDVVVAVAQGERVLASVEVHAAGRNVTAEAWAFLQGAGDRAICTVESFRTEHGDRVTFRGPTTSRALEVGASCRGFLPRRVPIRLGEHAIIELQPAASLAVHMLLPPVPKQLCTVQLTRADGQEEGSYYRTDDGFEWRDLAPGRYALRMLVDERPVHEVGAIDLVVGANVWPPDGNALDLRRSCQAVYFAVEAIEGGAIDRPRCHVLPRGRGAPPDDLDPDELKACLPRWFVPPPEPVDLVVLARGFVPALLPGPSADTVVRLTHCTPLRVHTASGLDACTIVRVVTDGVGDPWLRALDTENLHGSLALGAEDQPVELACAPGSILEITVKRGDLAGTPQRVSVGTTPIEFTAR